MEKENLKQIVVRVPADTRKALKMYCALTDKKLQNVINDAIVEKLKWDHSGGYGMPYLHILELLPYDELRPNYRANVMEQVFKDPSGREIMSRRTREPAPVDKEREGKKFKRYILKWKKECIKNGTFY